MRRLPIRVRLTLGFAVAMAVLFALLATLLYTSMNRALLIEVERGLRTLAQTVSSDLSSLATSPTRPLIESDESFAQVVSARDGRVLLSSSRFPSPALDPAAAGRIDRATFLELRVAGIDGRARILAVPATNAGSPVLIVVGSSLQDRADAMRAMTAYLAAGGPVALAVAAYAGWLVAGFALRPVERMRQQAAAISASELARRVDEPAANDEIRWLAATLNEMLARLEDAIRGERRFLDNASHELRTPLSMLKAELDLALARPRTAEELHVALRSASEETDRLARLAEDLLVLSRAHEGRLPIHRSETELRALVHPASELFAPRAMSAGVRIDVDAAAAGVIVDVARVRQAIDNLLDNAIRVSPRGGVVRVTGAVDDGRVVISVEDQGPGFAPGSERDAFEPGRAGLGLAIVKAVAEGHGGTARAENLPDGGARVSIFLRALDLDQDLVARPEHVPER